MKDEIKEILDNFKIYEDRYKKCNETQFIIFYRDIHLLLDYITNLQERIDKAIEYIEERKNLNWYADGVFVYELLNILNGGSNE